MDELGERQAIAITIASILFLAVPAVVFLALLFASGWLLVIHVHPRHMLWGWLSDTSTKDANGHTNWGIGPVTAYYLFGVFNAYLTYQLGELLYGGFSWFRRALT